jgi:hypothetical protein
MRWLASLFLAAGLLAGSLLAASPIAACSSGTASHDPLPPRPTGDPPPAQSAPTERECDELITHAVALGIDERAARPERTTQADHEAIRRKLHEEFVTGCRALSRDALACALAARTLSELAACQPSPSSSTSNSSVAPGGITPPAPRSP